jgi:hypothetical protein
MTNYQFIYFDLDNDMTAKITMTPHSADYDLIEILDKECKSSDNICETRKGTDEVEACEKYLSQGKYYIKIEKKQGSGTYDLSLDCTSQTCIDYDASSSDSHTISSYCIDVYGTHKDVCLDNNLEEYSCNNNVCSLESVDCQTIGNNYGCVSGRCETTSTTTTISGGGGGGGGKPTLVDLFNAIRQFFKLIFGNR